MVWEIRTRKRSPPKRFRLQADPTGLLGELRNFHRRDPKLLD